MSAAVVFVGLAWALAAVGLARRRSTRGLAPVAAVAAAAFFVFPSWRRAVVLIPVTLFVAILVSPDGAVRGRTGRYGVLAAAVIVAAVGRADPAPWIVLGIGLPVAALVGVSAASPFLRQARGITRDRLSWQFAGACSAVGAGTIVAETSWLLGGGRSGRALVVMVSALFPLAVYAASTRLVRQAAHAIVGATAIATIGAAMTAVTLVPTAITGRRPVSSERSFFVVMGATAAVSALGAGGLFQRLHQRLVGVFSSKRSPDSSLRMFANRLTRSLPLDELLLQLCESLMTTLGLSQAEVWTGSNGTYELAASVPHRRAASLVIDTRGLDVAARTPSAGAQWLGVWVPSLARDGQIVPQCVTPLVRDGHVLGLIVVERPPRTEVFDDHEHEVLIELAQSIALALHNAQLDTSLSRTLTELREQAADLQASRARLVAAADEERRRIERDLHDGAQQQLVALAVNMRTARQLLRTDPSALDSLLGELADEATAAADEVRALAHGVYPPLLRESGLAAALRGNATRLRSPVRLDVTNDRFAPDIEAALYFACLEAIQNAAKHAPGADVGVHVEVRDGVIHFDVSDTGPGLDPANTRLGRGMENVRDRVGAVGGRVRWSSRDGGGTTMVGTIKA